MADVQYSLAEVAKITGKSEKTISRWIKSGKLPAARQGTGYLINEDDIPLKINPSIDRHTFVQQRLMDQQSMSPPGNGSPINSRRVDMNNLMDVANLIAGGGQVDRTSPLDNINYMFQKHQAEVEKIIREQNELAEKYARATYKIGQLEERNRLLEEQNLKMEQKVSLLPAPEQWNATKLDLEQARDSLQEKDTHYQVKLREMESKLIELEKSKQELEDSQKQLQSVNTLLEHQHQELSDDHKQVTEALESERKKGFWQRLFGA